MRTPTTISSVEFKNFKAFSQFSLKLQHMNILVGPNNSGKSTVLSAFRTLAAGLRRARTKNPEWLEGPKGNCTGYRIAPEALPISMENVHTDYSDADTSVTFRLSNGNKLKLYFPRDGGCCLIPETEGKKIKSIKQFREAYPVSIGVVPVLGPVEHEEPVLNDETVRKDLATHRASRHFRNYWYQYPDGFQEFAALLKRTWPGMEIQAPEKVGPFAEKLSMFCLEKRISRELYWSGFGFQIWCQLLTHITRAREDSIVVVDEPENYLHPDVQRQLLAILRDAGPDILLATHSAEVMGEADPSEILVVDKTKASADRLKNFEGVQSALNIIGSVQNITLTQLARNRRILFVEGLDDFKILRKFAYRLGFTELSSGLDLTPVESGGFSAWEKIPPLAWGIEKALGSSLHLGAIFDRDYHCAEEIGQILETLGKSLELAHIHSRKEIENYLLNPTALERALAKALEEREVRTGAKASLLEPLSTVLERITTPLRNEIQSQYIAKRSQYLSHSPLDLATITSETMEFFDAKWGKIETRVEIVPGKAVLSALRAYVQENYSVGLTDYRIIGGIKREEIPSDLGDLIRRLEAFRTGNTTLIQ
jgi:energy-coupling factor transporter ATP-binding protein EcfA2